MKPLGPILIGLFVVTAWCSSVGAGPLRENSVGGAQQAQQGQRDTKDDELTTEFPLAVEVSKSQYDNPFENDMASLAKGEDLGMSPPILVILTATINGESHWTLICRRENVRNETNPCTPLAAGRYPARWVHNAELLQLLVKDDQGKFDSRFFDASPKRQDPPPADDKPLQTARYQFVISPPTGKRSEDYPMLLHVYGAVRLRFPVGQLPVHMRCTYSNRDSFTTQIDCLNAGGAEIYKGHVDLDSALDGSWGWTISCDAKWRWSKCAALGPGFYAARWRVADKRLLVVLAKVGEKTEEITFDAKKLPDLSEPPTARPPSP